MEPVHWFSFKWYWLDAVLASEILSQGHRGEKKALENAWFSKRVEKLTYSSETQSVKANWEPWSPGGGATKVEHVSLCLCSEGIFAELKSLLSFTLIFSTKANKNYLKRPLRSTCNLVPPGTEQNLFCWAIALWVPRFKRGCVGRQQH